MPVQTFSCICLQVAGLEEAAKVSASGDVQAPVSLVERIYKAMNKFGGSIYVQIAGF